MQAQKKYITPNISVFVLSPADRMMWDLESSGDKSDLGI